MSRKIGIAFMKRLSDLVLQFRSQPLLVQLGRLRWLIPIAVIALAAVHQAGLHFIANFFSERWRPTAELLIYGMTGSIVTWVAIADSLASRDEADKQLRSAYAALEANHQKLLTLQDFGQQVAAAGNEQVVLELAAQAPLQLTEAMGSTIVTFNDEKDRLKLDMAWGLSDDYLRVLRSRMDMGVPAARCRTCSTLKTEATSDCPLFDGLHQATQSEGIGGLICLPMVLEQERVGVISAYFPSPDGPPEDQVRLLNILSGAIGAMLDSLRVRTRQVRTLYELDHASQTSDAGTSSLNDFADQVLKITVAGWEAQAGGLFLFNSETQTWTCCARQGLGGDLTDARFTLALELVRRAQTSGTLIISPDLTPESAGCLLSAAAAPLVTEGQVFGAIFLGANRRRAFNSRHTEFLNAMSHQIALAMWNTQLYDQLNQLAVLKERYRLSREIHDGLAQTLAYLNLQAERLERLVGTGQNEEAAREINAMRQSIRSAYAESREAIEGLRFDLERPDEMAIRLREFAGQFNRQTGIQAQVTVEPVDLLVAPATALQLLRIVQESLANVRKHAEASRVEICLKDSGDELELSITDNGRGFPDASQADLAQQHFGLESMRERARSLDGALTVATGPQQGTRITVAVPLSDVKKIAVESL
jgi:two-component system nitrate/nitrite sensor histidine kinase NarX